MILPRCGLTLHCNLLSFHDADTFTVSVLDGRLRPAIRLYGVNAPESDTEEGKRANRFALAMLEAAEQLYVHIPEPKHLRNLLDGISFRRIPAWIFLAEATTLNEELVAGGHARKDPKYWPKDMT